MGLTPQADVSSSCPPTTRAPPNACPPPSHVTEKRPRYRPLASYQLNEEVTFASTSGPTPFRYHYRVEPITYGTRLTLNGDISGEGLPGPAAHLGGLAGRLFKQGMRKNLHVLKRILENDGARG
jgi:hypothetical protein